MRSASHALQAKNSKKPHVFLGAAFQNEFQSDLGSDVVLFSESILASIEFSGGWLPDWDRVILSGEAAGDPARSIKFFEILQRNEGETDALSPSSGFTAGDFCLKASYVHQDKRTGQAAVFCPFEDYLGGEETFCSCPIPMRSFPSSSKQAGLTNEKTRS